MFGAPTRGGASGNAAETDCSWTDDEGFGLGLLFHHLRSLAQTETSYKFLTKQTNYGRSTHSRDGRLFATCESEREPHGRDALGSPQFYRGDFHKPQAAWPPGPTLEDLRTPRFVFAPGASGHAAGRPSESEVSVSAEAVGLGAPARSGQQS